ncbi:MAG: hypothetical protein LBL62_07045, partial [Planctomycetaceae bacterium]|nr:hypothetical protein [Planctomycetaceae bacterium]
MKNLIKITNSIIGCLGCFLMLTVFSTVSAVQTVLPLESPNKEHKVEIITTQINQTGFKIYYKNKLILTGFDLDFLFKNGKKLSEQTAVVKLPDS